MFTSVRAKLGVVFLGFLLLGAGSVTATFITIRTQAADARVINLAGRQRMLTQEMTKAVLGIARDPTSDYRTELDEAAYLFDRTLTALLDGGLAPYGEEGVTLPPAKDISIRAQLGVVAELWNQFWQEVETVQTADLESAAFASAVREIESLSPVILQEMDQVVRLCEAAAELKLIRLSAIQAVFLVSAVGLLIAGYLLTQRTIVNPISALEAATRRMAGGDLVSPIEVEPAASGEIGALARSFEGMREELARLHQEEIERERLEQELAVARQIQLTMLPKGCPVLPGWECAVFYQAARQVGGDFYDFFELPGEPKRMGIVIADVADKGVPAALSMALGRTVIRNAAAGGRSPSAALTLANELILKDTQAGLFVTAVYAALDARSGRLAYAIAGHNRPLWLQVGTGEIQELTAQGIVLGILEDIELEEREICVVPGDFLVFYTDGVTEAMDAHGQTFGEERLQAAVATNLDASAQQILSTVLDAVKTFTGDAPQSDDLALLVVRRCP